MRMRISIILSLALVSSVAAAAGETCRIGGSALSFVDGEEAKRRLAAEDGFVHTLSAFDRAARLKSDHEIDTPTYLKFLSEQARSWSADERRELEAAWCDLAHRIDGKGWKLTLPKSVLLIKSSGLEEGQTPYTRGDAIIIPERVVAAKMGARVLPHELFHVFSRTLGKSNPARQNALYKIVGYTPLDGEFEVPVELRARAITNPDSFAIRHGVTIKRGDTTVLTVPFLFASPARYDAKQGGEFFRYLQFKLLPVHREGKSWRVDRDKEGQPLQIDPLETNYSDVVGRNTEENFQADEVLAANFDLALAPKAPPIADGWIIKQLDAALKQ